MTDQQPMSPEPCEHHWIHYGQPNHSPIRWIVKCSQCHQFDIAALQEEVRAIRAEVLRDAAESNDLIGHMYREYDDHPLRSTLAPANVRATSNYLHNQADQMEGDDD